MLIALGPNLVLCYYSFGSPWPSTTQHRRTFHHNLFKYYLLRSHEIYILLYTNLLDDVMLMSSSPHGASIVVTHVTQIFLLMIPKNGDVCFKFKRVWNMMKYLDPISITRYLRLFKVGSVVVTPISTLSMAYEVDLEYVIEWNHSKSSKLGLWE